MRKPGFLILSFLGLSLFAAFAGWAVFAVSDGRGGSHTALIYAAGGALAVAAFGAAFIALATHGARAGFDERIEPD